MARRAATFLVFATLLFVSLGANAAVPLPKDDPFYAAPATMTEPPGTILRSREVKVAGLGVPLPFKAWQLFYASTDAHDRPAGAVTTLIMPLAKPATPGPRPLVSYHTAEDSLDSHCAMSYKLRMGTEKEEPNLLPLLMHGWAVAVPDYEGLDSQLGAGIQAGHAILDGLRAALRFAPAELGPNTPIGMWGYSGGALATSRASELAPGYAPELSIVGISEGGVPASFDAVAKYLDGGPFSSLLLAASVGLSRAYPEMQTLWNEKGKVLAAELGAMCIEEYATQTKFAFQSMDTYTTVPNAIDLPWVQDILTLNSLGRFTPTAPIFLFHAINDEMLPTNPVNAIVDKYCRNGVTILYYQDAASEHISLAVTGAPAAVAYLASRFAGADAPSSCGLPHIPGLIPTR